MLEPPSCPTENGGGERKGHQKGLRRATEGKADESLEPRAAKSIFPHTPGPGSFF